MDTNGIIKEDIVCIVGKNSIFVKKERNVCHQGIQSHSQYQHKQKAAGQLIL